MEIYFCVCALALKLYVHMCAWYLHSQLCLQNEIIYFVSMCFGDKTTEKLPLKNILKLTQ